MKQHQVVKSISKNISLCALCVSSERIEWAVRKGVIQYSQPREIMFAFYLTGVKDVPQIPKI
jgi:hypothetical protein